MATIGLIDVWALKLLAQAIADWGYHEKRFISQSLLKMVDLPNFALQWKLDRFKHLFILLNID